MGLHTSGGTAGFSCEIEETTGNRFYLENGPASVGSTFTVPSSDGWVLVVAGKATGTTSVDFWKYVYSTNTWTVETAVGSMANATAVGTSGTVRLGQWETFSWFPGDIAVAGLWNRKLVDAEVRGLPFTLGAWHASTPVGLWVLDQSATTQNVADLTGNGGNQTALTSTTVATSSVPVFNYGAGPILVTRPQGGPVDTPVSLAGSQPAATGALTREKDALRSLAGSQPAATGVLSRVKAALRALAGSEPTATGALARSFGAIRALAGAQAAAYASGAPTLISDTFNRADDALTLGTADSGQSWVAGMGTWGISGNKAYAPSATLAARGSVVVSTSVSDCVLSVDAATNVNGPSPFIGIVARYQDSLNYLRVIFKRGTSANVELDALSTSALDVLAVGDAVITYNVPCNLRVVLNGTSVTVYVNGRLVINATTSAFLTETSHGLAWLNASDLARWDNFTATGPSIPRVLAAVRSLTGSQPAATGVLARSFGATRALTGSQPAATGTLSHPDAYGESVWTTAGLVSHWRLGEPSGTLAVDSKDSNDGTYTNAPTLGVAGLLTSSTDTAATFATASSQYVQVNDSASLEFPTGDFSFECWINTTSGGGSILSKGDGAGASESEYIWQVRGQGLFFLGAWRALAGIDNLAAGATHHLVVVFDSAATTLRPYVDGVAQATTTGVTGTYATDLAHPFFIGRQGDVGENFLGATLDEVAVYNSALSSATVLDHFDTGQGGVARSIAGNQPAATGALARSFDAIRALAGAQPTATGTLTRVAAAVRSLTGNQPAATGVLTRSIVVSIALAGAQPAAAATLTRVKAALRSLAGAQPSATGTLSRLLAVLRTLDGSQPSATATLARTWATLRSLAGSQPAATGTLARVLAALRALAGSEPTPTGTLAASHGTSRALAGSQPTATGTLARVFSAIRSLAGSQPSATGVLARSFGAVRALAGAQPAATGTLARLLAALRSLTGAQPTATGELGSASAYQRSISGSQPAAAGVLGRVLSAVRALTGAQPNATGALARVLGAVRALSGSQPTATGTLTRSAVVSRSLAGNQPAPTGDLSQAGAGQRSLAGSQPTATGTLSRLIVVARALAGSQPSATGVLARVLDAVRSATGDQPTATGTLSRAAAVSRSLTGAQPAAAGTLSTDSAAQRSVDGAQPAATGVLSRLLAAARSLLGAQPTSTGTLTRSATSSRSLDGDQPASTGTLSAGTEAQRSLSGDQPAATGTLDRSVAVTRALDGDQPTGSATLDRLLHAARGLSGSQPAASGALTVGVPPGAPHVLIAPDRSSGLVARYRRNTLTAAGRTASLTAPYRRDSLDAPERSGDLTAPHR